MNRRGFLNLAGFVVLGLGLVPAHAQQPPAGYPDRPIELVVVYPAGGGMDVTARALAKEAERVLGHSFRVQNRTGGGGLIGHTYLAKNAAPDGYTLGVIGNPNLLLDFLAKEGDFDQKSFTPIVGINFTPTLWVVQADGPLGKLDFKGIIERAKAEPGKLKIGIVPGSAFEFVTDIVEKQTGAKFTRVPFQGGKPGVVSLLGGNIDITSTFYDEAEPQIRAGQLKVLASSDSKRFSALPDVPTMPELGVPLQGGLWGATRIITVHPATPEPIQTYLESAFLKVLRDPQAVANLKKVGILAEPADRAGTQRVYNESVGVLNAFLNETGRARKR